MPDDRLVVADTSPLLNLALIDRLDLLETQFSGVTVPEQVWTELSEGDEGLAGLRELRESGFLTLVSVDRSGFFIEIVTEPDLGETAAIRYAVEEGLTCS
jgi:predicted nucleic acid-binding protein